MARILVTGVNGFVGKHLVQALISAGHSVIGTGTTKKTAPENKGYLYKYFVADLTKVSNVAKLPLSAVDSIINLAGLANVAESFGHDELYKKVNVEVLSHICEQLTRHKLKTRILAISSGNVYDPYQKMPLTESSRSIEQGSPYAQSKIEMEKIAFKYRESGLDIVVVRPFNHSGPGQQNGFLIPDLFDAVIAYKKNGKPVNVGNLKTRRDYTDVRDVVQAYIALATTKKLKNSLYNVCSGISRPGEEILNLISRELGVGKKLILDVDKSLIRPNDPEEIFGSFERINAESGWKPAIPIEQTIADFVKYQEMQS